MSLTEKPRAAALEISDDAFRYLVLQRGAISDLAGERAAWERAYRLSLKEDFEGMREYLPENQPVVLDVGGGLGGIDIMLARHYGMDLDVTIMDGIADRPSVIAHAETFSNAMVANRFLRDNGLKNLAFLDPRELTDDGPTYSLIVSLQAWCFHFNPETYLDFVRGVALPGAILILDVRRDYADWQRTLKEAFSFIGIASEGKKSQRIVFRHG